MGLTAEQETEAIETTLRRLRAEARKAEAEARKAEHDADELARLRELSDAVRAWTIDYSGTADSKLAATFDRLIRWADGTASK